MQRTSFTIHWNSFVLAGIIAIKFLLQYLAINPVYELQRDEYLHLDQANHLAWGYLSIPPFTSWIAWVIRELGNGVFWVKLFPALFGALTIVIVWKVIKTLGGNLFARVLGSLAVLFSALLRLNSLFQPNSVDVVYDKLQDRDATLILCDNYGEAGAINYYSRNKGIQAVTFEADYLNWIHRDEKIRHLIRIKEGSERSDEMRKTGSLFEASFVADSVTNPYSREYQTTIFVFSEPKIDVSRRLKEEVEKNGGGVGR